MKAKLLAFLFILVSGYYFTDISGYGTWWVEEGETPPAALLRITNESGACVVSNLVNSLKMEFPGDPATLQINVCK